MSGERASRADFDALIGPHLEAGYRTALAILRNPDEAHDAVQESAFKDLRMLNPTPATRPPRHRLDLSPCFPLGLPREEVGAVLGLPRRRAKARASRGPRSL